MLEVGYQKQISNQGIYVPENEVEFKNITFAILITFGLTNPFKELDKSFLYEEDTLVKESSQSMHFVIWGGLAVLVVLMAVQRMSQ